MVLFLCKHKESQSTLFVVILLRFTGQMEGVKVKQVCAVQMAGSMGFIVRMRQKLYCLLEPSARKAGQALI